MDIPKIYVRKHGVINLGRQGENDVRQVVWQDVLGEWETQFGAGKVQLAVTRPEDEAPYLANIDVADGEITWTITNAETAKVGDGSCELSYIVGDAVKKSQTWTTYVCPSLTGQEPSDPPEPYQSWVDKIMQEAADLKIQGVPKGGKTGQFLGKKSDGDFDTEWMDVKAGVESVNGKTGAVVLNAEDVGALPDTTEIPKPDWNENDENSANYVKNRTHYMSADYGHTRWAVQFPNFTWEDKGSYYSASKENVTLHYGWLYTISLSYPSGKGYSTHGQDTTCVRAYEMMGGNTTFGLNIKDGIYDINYNYGEDNSKVVAFIKEGWDGKGRESDGSIPFGTELTGTIELRFNKNYYSTSPSRVDISSTGYTFHPLNQRYLPSSTVLLDTDSSTLKSPTGTDITDNVKQIVKDGASIVLAHITQDGEDAEGNPRWVSDKTYDELKAAYDRGDLLGVVPQDGWEPWEFYRETGSETYIPFDREDAFGLFFYISNPLSVIDVPVDIGAYYIQEIALVIFKIPQTGETVVIINYAEIPDYEAYVLPDVHRYFPLPQQYAIMLMKDNDGTITSPTPFSEIARCIMAYVRNSQDIFKDGKLGFVDMLVTFSDDPTTFFKLSGYDGDDLDITKVIFSATTSRGLETVTVSNDGTNDVWTHEVKPFSTLALPAVSTSDDGKILQVVNGRWAAVELTNANGVNF